MTILIIFPFYPDKSLASVTHIGSIYGAGYDTYRITDEFETEISSGTSGASSLKTSSGSTKYIPTEGAGRYIAGASFIVKTALDANNYVVVTLGDGHTIKFDSQSNFEFGIGLDDFKAHPSKGIIAVLYSDGKKDRYVKLTQLTFGTGTTPTDPTPEPEPTIPTNPTTPVEKLDIKFNDPVLSWGLVPSTADKIKIFKDGKLVTSLNAMENSYDISRYGSGKYSIYVFDSSNQVVSSNSYQVVSNSVPIDPNPVDPNPVDPNPVDPNPVDPNPVECSPGCQTIIDSLDCPEFDDYLGKWADMIKTTYPPPPNWHEVASVMRDTIVPAMGQEIVNRSPEIAKIIADEFQSREKAVQPPQPVGTYTPPTPLPKMKDMPEVVDFDLDNHNDTFNPDYTDSKPFVIPDPADVKLTDTDSGYTYPLKTDDSGPDYKSVTTIAPDKGYQGKPSVDTSSPTYSVTNPIVNNPGPEYYYINGGQTQIPIYKNKVTTVTSPGYVSSDKYTTTPNYNP